MTSTQHSARDPRQQDRAATPATVTVLPTSELTAAAPTADTADVGTDPKALARAALKSRHSQGLSKLYTDRDDLRGVHALADFVHDSVRWTA